MKLREVFKVIWKANRSYVTNNLDQLSTKELCKIAKEQDALYVAWADGDFSRLENLRYG